MKLLRAPHEPELKEERWRFQVVVYLVIGVFLVLALRLWFLQLIQGQYYRNLSENNRIRLESVPPTRGIIYDRHGRILVDNRPAFNLAIVPEDVDDLQQILSELSLILGLRKDVLRRRIRKAPKSAPFHPLVLERDISRDELAKVESHKFDLHGVTVQIEAKRSYKGPAFAAHLIGYLGEIEERQLKDSRYRGYRLGDYLGKYGIEMQWEKFLRGHRGGRQVEVDAAGRQLRVLHQMPPQAGQNLVLTLDASLQLRAERALRGRAGAIIAMNPENGDILAMVSSPPFDQNQFIRGFSPGRWRAIVSNPLRPLENKAIQGQYPPGSTFKPVVAAAALEEGVVKPDTVLVCNGKYRLGKRLYRCWRKAGHGHLNLYQALVQSCDIYFYQLGQRLGVARLARYARLFGLGRPTSIRLSNEAYGLVPTAQWKMEHFGIPWQKGEDLIMAIGQGFLLVTPMQIGVLYGAIANGGQFFRPRLVQRVEDARGRTLKKIDPEVTRKLPLKPSTLAFLQKALVGAVEEPRGTGGAARLRGITVAGKTGTAQIVRLDQKKMGELKQNRYEFRDHAWFVGYAPAESPEILVVVLVEHGGHGGSSAAPLARQVMQEYFKGRAPSRMAQKHVARVQ